VVRPRLSWAVRETPGPPKRFAQGIGASLSVAAVVAVALGFRGVASGLVAAVLAAASLEAFLGVCLGCHLFRLLMRVGLVPAETCEACTDLWGTR
jgi:cytosine/uracil/thiamine/allantoin permease